MHPEHDGRVSPGEDFVAHRSHGEFADRADEAKGDIEVVELESKALSGAEIGNGGLGPGDPVALTGATELRFDGPGLPGEMSGVGGEQLTRPRIGEAGTPVLPERLEEFIAGRPAWLWAHREHGALGEPRE